MTLMRNQPSPPPVFSEVVSLRAWCDGLASDAGEAPMHIAASFTVGRLGGEEPWPHAFKVGLRRAEIWVIINEGEPVRVMERGVFQPTGSVEVRRKLSQSNSERSQNQQKRRASLGITDLGLGGDVERIQENSGDRGEDLETCYQTNGFRITHGEPGGSNRWEVEPEIEPLLRGAVWDADVPKLILKRLGRQAREIDAVIRVEVRCLRDDLDIQLIPERAETQANGIAPDQIQRIAAAEACLKNAIMAYGLEAPNFKHVFGKVTLASIRCKMIDTR